VAVYITQQQNKIESIGDAFVLAITGMYNDSATKLTEQYYKFLVLIWVVGNGYARTLIKLDNPPDNDKIDSLLEKAQEMFKAGYKIVAATWETGRQNGR
jgi:hypothetical protein